MTSTSAAKNLVVQMNEIHSLAEPRGIWNTFMAEIKPTMPQNHHLPIDRDKR